MAIIKELKAFLMRGSVVDLAVGIIIGAAFGDVVKAAVEGLLMPLIGSLTAGVNFKDAAFTLNEIKVPDPSGGSDKVIPGAKLAYGLMIDALVKFMIIGTFLFFIIKAVNKMKPKEEPKAKETPEDVKLLAEIRDLLKK
jgi:large conductance mechanosensitive channel